MTRAVVIHGHFYQPPRENPWTGSIDREPSAAPFHDWNERIHHESYRANAHARILDRFDRIEQIVNNYEQISFNFGPTLMSWLARKHAATYERLLEADRASARANGGHGNAIAQAYNHVILPLANDRDMRTQIRWGLADFTHRFGREAESLWLAETACCDRTMAALVDAGLRYVILSPHQAGRVRPIASHGGSERPEASPEGGEAPTANPGGKKQAAAGAAKGERPHEVAWRDVHGGTIDTTVPYRWVHPDGSGRSIAVFFYDAALSQAVAFEGALASSQGFVDRLCGAGGGDGGLIHLATDGETYGHHQKGGDRGLAYALRVLAPGRDLRVTNYGAWLDEHPPRHEVQLEPGPGGEGTAWSCAHGVGRWYRDCGCATDVPEGWNQAWRSPLRRALDMVRDEAAALFEERGAELLADPWGARDRYVDVVLDREGALEGFLRQHARGHLDERGRVTVRTLLELQRHAMLMYTSCGWFFGELSRIETVQVLKYAARALDLFEELAPGKRHVELRQRFLGTLAEARSNLPEQGNGADVFTRQAETHRVRPQTVAAHLAFEGMVGELEPAGGLARYHFGRRDDRRRKEGRVTLATGRISLTSRHTGRYSDWAFAALHLGGVDFYAAVRPDPGDEAFGEASARLWRRFDEASLPVLLRLAEEAFGPDEFGLEHVLPQGRQVIFEAVFRRLVERFAAQYAHLYEDNRRTVEMLHRAGFDLPAELRAAAELSLGRRFEEEIVRQHRSRDPKAYAKAVEIADEVSARGYHIHHERADRIFGDMLTDAVRAATEDPASGFVGSAIALAKLRRRLALGGGLERAQEAFYGAREALPRAEPWTELADLLGLSPQVLDGQQRETPSGSARSVPSRPETSTPTPAPTSRPTAK